MQACLDSANIISRHDCADSITQALTGGDTNGLGAIILAVAFAALFATVANRLL